MTKCIIQDCGREVLVRGLCDACYQNANKRILKGEIHSWQFLEEHGLSLPLPKRKVVETSPFTKQFKKIKDNLEGKTTKDYDQTDK